MSLLRPMSLPPLAARDTRLAMISSNAGDIYNGIVVNIMLTERR